MHIKESVHIKECAHIKELSIKDSQSIYSAPKKIYKLRSKISSFSNAEKYLNKKNNEEIFRSSIGQGKFLERSEPTSYLMKFLAAIVEGLQLIQLEFPLGLRFHFYLIQKYGSLMILLIHKQASHLIKMCI